ncbi:hypothetical protein L4X63_12715 [Geomonas sp. Red32]|uniref:hypothetical protein n=1 Tax=Geomonas sp. Red32 TaxID=2912856 RepID=UPI00202CBBA2|nr:hypothetical protein [Geomonas sp. Red32]MCM0082453.1 hypothetical protein [Geomonas sp. Red32]
MRYVLSALLVLSVLVKPVLAQEFGNWAVDAKSEKFLYAATVNESGALLGQFCFVEGGSCVWLIGMDTGCNKGDEYTVLANSDAGSSAMQVLCDGQLDNGMYRYGFSDFESIDTLLKTATRVGFAVPLQSDQFKVFRFKLEGAKPAISVMRALAEKRMKNSETGTKDDTI